MTTLAACEIEKARRASKHKVAMRDKIDMSLKAEGPEHNLVAEATAKVVATTEQVENAAMVMIE